MFEPLVWATGLFCVVAFLVAWRAFRDVFHPLILTIPMFAFFYVLMPLYLIRDGQIFSYVSESQCTFVQAVLLGGVIAFVLGCFLGSHYGPKPSWKNAPAYDRKLIQKSGYLLGGIGLAAWMFTVQNAGGIANVFSRPKGWVGANMGTSAKRRI